LVTVSSLLVQASARLGSGPHPERARFDAETLLLYVLEKNKAWLLAHGDEELPAAPAAHFAAFVERRERGEPIQYITGRAEFYGLPFRVTPGVLIPRPETEHLVEKTIASAAKFPAPRIVDVGTGSGSIAVALASAIPHAEILAIDLSAAALEIARENARLNGMADRIRFLSGDLLEPVLGESVDLVVSNPPYVPETDRPALAIEVRDFEPALALFAGSDGLDAYRRLIPAAAKLLNPGGFLLLEIGFGQGAAVSGLLKAGEFERIESTPDLQGIPRVLSAQRR
jgi:release factor glutamine methyltransferase